MMSYHKQARALEAPSEKLRPMASKPKDMRKTKPLSFDPEDLTRRLHIVLAEQKAYADRKRRSRANIDRASLHLPTTTDKRRGREVPLEIAANEATAAKSAQATAARRSILSSSTKRLSKNPPEPPQLPDKDELPSYHHVPRVAASQFTRTTALEPASDKGVVHKLSRKAMKFHMEGPNASNDTAENAPVGEQTKGLQRAWSQRQKEYGRNQFQHPAILESSADMDERQNRLANRHTFDAYFRMKPAIDEGEENANPRLSIGSARGHDRAGRDSFDPSIGMYPVLSQDSADYQDLPVRAEDHRVDWTQSDEKPMSPPPLPGLRKADSKWTLKGRLSFHRGSKSEKDMLAVEDLAVSPTLRSPKSGFFSRFKR